MSAAATMVCRDLFVRYVDGKSARVVCHRVWDAERFMAARIAECDNANADARQKCKPGDPIPLLADVQQITQEQYRAERAR